MSTFVAHAVQDVSYLHIQKRNMKYRNFCNNTPWAVHFFKGLVFIRTTCRSIKNYYSIKYLPLNNSIKLSLQHFQRLTSLCRCNG